MFDKYLHYRCFLTIVPPAEVRSELRDLNRHFKKHARNFRFIPLDQLHITLQFLGNTVSGESLLLIQENLNPLINNLPRLKITIDRLNFGFPSQNIATHLFYTIRENKDLEKMVKEIHESLKSLSLTDVNKKKDHSKLINHLTVARVKGTSSRSFSREMKEFISQIEIKPITFELQEFRILSSNFKDNTTNYSELLSFPLQKLNPK